MSTLLVFRSDTGTEIARQVIDDPERANRIMIARNRAELMHRTGWTWGIETVVEQAQLADPAERLATDQAHLNGTRPRSLSCCVCGAGTRGVQWWNRDTGYGICTPCAVREARRESPAVMQSYYGVAGVNYAVTETEIQ